MSGTLFVVGLGPGPEYWLTGEAQAVIARAELFFGYAPYLARLVLRDDQQAIASDNREELDRARAALDAAASGKTVAMVSGGDPGVFAMAAAVCEVLDTDAAWPDVTLEVVPGITAMLAVAARLGAPLGNDFCVLSLSDNLKPWSVIETRLRAAATAGFAIALYNPVSKARPTQLDNAFNILRDCMPHQIPVIFGRAVGRPAETIAIVPLSEARADMADMATCVIIGTPLTRIIERASGPIVYTPRFVPETPQ